jgi:hypothetical protein
MGAAAGDLLLFAAGDVGLVNRTLDRVRQFVAKTLEVRTRSTAAHYVQGGTCMKLLAAIQYMRCTRAYQGAQCGRFLGPYTISSASVLNPRVFGRSWDESCN